jgi:hypothetical protein
VIGSDRPGCATIAIGRVAVGIRASDAAFLGMLAERYAGFIDDTAAPHYAFDVSLVPCHDDEPDAELRVVRDGHRWKLERGDFRADWDPLARRGWIRQSASPYAIDAVLRIVHTLVLAGERGFLMHAASAIRNGRAFLFAGASGAGKTTISRLAPADVRLLTDEISYVRAEDDGFCAYGTPFAGELAKSGENLRSPLAAIYLLAHGSGNRIDTVSPVDAARALLANILFFADDRELVQSVFGAALDCAESVPVRRLAFVPDESVWELIR